LLQRIVKDLFSTEEKKRELKWKLNTFWKFSLSQKTSFSQTNGLLCRLK
jgi:transposase